MDYSRYLVLYSGGVDSTHFIESEPSAKHLIFYKGRNSEQENVALSNANTLDRFITVVERGPMGPGRDGETNNIHALYDTSMILDASITAISFGMKGVVVCFNADDIGVDEKAIASIMHRVDSNFEILQPLRHVAAADIRSQKSKGGLPAISCMNGNNCGYCAKCKKGH